MKKVFIIGFLIILVLSCSSKDIKEIYIKSNVLKVEIADTIESRAKGLMYRKTLPENTGMLFIFEKDQQLSFWMKNTYVPLSIAYISSDGIIKDILNMKALSLSSVKSTFYVRYALELPQGNFERLGIEPGDSVDLSNIESLIK